LNYIRYKNSAFLVGAADLLLKGMKKKILLLLASLILVAGLGIYLIFQQVTADLPPIESLKDYHPLLVTHVVDRNGKKMGEIFKERRTLLPINQIPKTVIQAFLAAEDDQFYQHQGVNWLAILRAMAANLRAGHTVQGASTITQQLVKTMLLTSEKTYTRKIKELVLAQRLESKLTKDEILYLYLNQIFFGQNSYGLAMASETYFRKPVDRLTLSEAAILAGLPKAPSAYSPVRNPKKAKDRQLYVLNRMKDLGYIPQALAKQAAELPVKVYLRESFVPQAHGVVETVKILLSKELSEERLSSEGYRIKTSIDLDAQIMAQQSVEDRLRELDKRQGYRGPLEKIDKEQQPAFLKAYRENLLDSYSPAKIILPIGEFEPRKPFDDSYSAANGLPKYIEVNKIYKALVTEVSDGFGILKAKVAELPGIVSFESAKWARPYNPSQRSYPLVRLSSAFKVGDVIWVKVKSSTYKPTKLQLSPKAQPLAPQWSQYVELEVEQEPKVEGAALSLDNSTEDVVALVGGFDFARSQFNRVLQAKRQTGSAFKTFVYAAALDHGYSPSSILLDAPIVFENQGQKFNEEWKPANHSKSYDGDITFRNALIRSLNVPAVKVLEDIGTQFAIDYVRRLKIFSPLNSDFTLVLGSSSVTLFEMTRAFGIFARLGKNLNPRIVLSVTDSSNKEILKNIGLDLWFKEDLLPFDTEFEENRKAYLEKKALATPTPNLPIEDQNNPEKTADDDSFKSKYPLEEAIYFDNPNQLISPQTAYIVTSILEGVITDPNGTAARAASELSFSVAGKTGSTNDYNDGWFIGYSPKYTTGVWVGFDQDQTLGPGEVGGRTALPIWIDMMKYLHPDPKAVGYFQTPPDIEFASIEYESGQKAQAGSSRVIKQAFRAKDILTLEQNQIDEQDIESTKEDLL